MIQLQNGWGQFTPKNWGQFAPEYWGQFHAEKGGLFGRNFHLSIINVLKTMFNLLKNKP